MRCPVCGGANVDGAKFCGVCGQRMALEPAPPAALVPVTAETRAMAPPPAPSLGASLRVPEARGARAVRIGLVLALDLGLAITGVILLTGGGRGERGDTAAPAQPADAGVKGDEVAVNADLPGGGPGDGATDRKSVV